MDAAKIAYDPSYYHQLHVDVHTLMTKTRDRFFDYYVSHKFKQLSATTPEAREAASEKANANWLAAKNCQELLDNYPLPVPLEVKNG